MDQFPSTEIERRAKAQANRVMFDRIAHRYDLLNGVMSLGMDDRWRRRLVAGCAVTPGARCLDLCCGTGDVARALSRRGGEVIGVDASAGMLAVACARADAHIDYVQADVLRLPFPAQTFDVVTIAFGNRNVASLSGLYAEMRRVAKPGGRIASLEIHRPDAEWLTGLFFLYFAYLPSLVARLVGADPSAYRYLPESVRQYPRAGEVAAIIEAAGLHDVQMVTALGGIIAMHRATR